MRARVLVVVVLALAGCNTLPVPRMGSHGTDTQSVDVTEMPPPAKVEEPTERPPDMKQPVWIAGQWMWTGHDWTWKDGRWEEDKEGEVYAPPKTMRAPDGKLVHYPGTWTERSVTVPYPPPPGKVEIILDRPRNLKHPVWVDGQWLWMGRRWTWKDGGWEENREGEYYAPPKTARIWDGTLVHYPGLWKKDASASSPAAPSPAASSSAAPSPAAPEPSAPEPSAPEPSAPAPTAAPGPGAR